MIIKDLQSEIIIDSFGKETVQVTLITDDNRETTASVPAGISAGKYEAKMVSAAQAIEEIKRIKEQLINFDWEQKSLDDKLISMGLGGNTTLVLSAVFWKSHNLIKPGDNLNFPVLLLLLFEGGKHGNPGIFAQEFLLLENSLQQAITDFNYLRKCLEDNKVETTVGAEGGFSPKDFNDQKVLETIAKVFPERSLALDVAGSFEQGTINYEEILEKYPIVSLEDPYSDEEWNKWQEFTAKHGQQIMVVGDDLTTTNLERLQKAIDLKAINAIIIKPNQNGTISGTLEVVDLAKKNGIKIIVSHRGEETADDWIVDFAISVQADYVKFGGMDRGERVAKYNRLLELGMK